MRKITVIGLCGRSGSGKGYISSVFAKHGVPSIDTDKVYRDILSEKCSPCLSEIVDAFGVSVLSSDGSLDRKELAKRVFGGSKESLSRLNSITHKYIMERTKEEIKKAEDLGCAAVIVDAPVLFESGFDKICHLKMCVTAPDDVCIDRIKTRDGLTDEEAQRRLSNQKTADELRGLCDFEIVNDGKSDVADQVERAVANYLQEEK